MFKFILAAVLSLAALTPAHAESKSQKVTHATLPNYLKTLGYNVEVVAAEIGAPVCKITLEKDGWSFVIEVSATSDGVVCLTAPLVEVPQDKLGSAKFLQLLEVNLTIAPCSFAYRSGDNQICLRLQVTDTSDAGLNNGLALLTEKIRLTFPIWGQGGW